jgi:Nitrile hydratase beta subunit
MRDGDHEHDAEHQASEVDPLQLRAFDEHELWGDDSAQRSTISVDAWEPYLEPA